MVRSMYAGVAGMKAHQTRMDVIGNNIANVNTYGFKASRVTFRDVYYQMTSGASAATAIRGGVNPRAIGSGAKVSGVDLLMNQSSFAATDNGLDLAIAGEGFFMVQDPDGNTFYTRAGMLNVDSAGNIVDTNGNFVLGVSGNPLGRTPSTERIQIQLPSVSPTAGSAIETINSKEFSITATNATAESNVTLNFQSSTQMPIGQAAAAQITTSGIVLTLNANEVFTSISDFNDKINAAIIEANGGSEHPAGRFNITTDTTPDPFAGLTGAEIASKDFSVTPGVFSLVPPTGLFDIGSMQVKKVSSNFLGSGSVSPTITWDGVTQKFAVTVTTATGTYTGEVGPSATNPGTLLLKNGAEYIEISHPGWTQLVNLGGGDPADTATTPPDPTAFTPAATITCTPSTPSKALGFSLKPISLSGGTEGGPQTVADLSSLSIGSDGIIEGMHPLLGRLQLGRISIATFENSQGLLEVGNTYFQESANSGKANLNVAGTSGSGSIAAGSLEMSNVDLSREFSDMIVTQRGFQANTKIITVSDEMLNELVNLKR